MTTKSHKPALKKNAKSKPVTAARVRAQAAAMPPKATRDGETYHLSSPWPQGGCHRSCQPT